MGKGILRGPVPKDHPMFSSGPEIFSRLELNRSSKNTAANTTGDIQATSSSAPQDPMQPAADAVEQFLSAEAKEYGKNEDGIKAMDETDPVDDLTLEMLSALRSSPRHMREVLTEEFLQGIVDSLKENPSPES